MKIWRVAKTERVNKNQPTNKTMPLTWFHQVVKNHPPKPTSLLNHHSNLPQNTTQTEAFSTPTHQTPQPENISTLPTFHSIITRTNKTTPSKTSFLQSRKLYRNHTANIIFSIYGVDPGSPPDHEPRLVGILVTSNRRVTDRTINHNLEHGSQRSCPLIRRVIRFGTKGFYFILFWVVLWGFGGKSWLF